MSYPTEAELTTFVGTIPDLTLDASYDLALPLARAISAWESLTGWHPYIKDGTDKTHYFDPPKVGTHGCVLNLRKGLLVLTSLTTGLNYDQSGGSALTQNTDFKLWPYDGGLTGEPWTQIHFKTTPYGEPGTIKLIGRFGKVDSCPDDVKLAILSYATALTIDPMAGANGSLQRVKQGPVEYEFSKDSTANRLTAAFKWAASDHRVIWL
jgi:hypothetical protein